MTVRKLQNNFPNIEEEEEASMSYNDHILTDKDKHILYAKNLLLVKLMF